MIITMAEPYMARQCPECKLWIFVDDGPFAENDRTKTLADVQHWEAEHVKPEDYTHVRGARVLGIPYMHWNEDTVEAVVEDRG